MLSLIFLIGTLISVVFSTAKDFPNVRIYASAPHTYNHLTGGGAINDQTVGRDFDVVSSLEGDDFKCNVCSFTELMPFSSLLIG
jgi:hypothetical protein